ncbi:mutS domain-containing protein [Rhizoctonia solani AG-1 IA]|uniref:MutS domain-containing protein n=1 Tax=Thanatephorus cucumeris (strain AG1-IA) TaxID=983506 RepID=L8WL13_THACA|nr:mutS domain-containing protein [Rhizoctonia solani AG-1 IA]
MSSRGAIDNSFLVTPRRNTYNSKARSARSVSRPQSVSRTSMSRPTTAASTAGEYSTHVIAVLEGRGVAREIGMAALNKSTGQCVIFQPTSKSKISPLVESIRDEFEDDVDLVPIPRKYWNDGDGESMLVSEQHADQKPGTLLALSNKQVHHFFTSNILALINFTAPEIRMNTTFAPRSVRISFRSPEDQMAIERRLEVVQVNDEEKYTAIRDALKPIRSKDFDKLIAQLSTSDTHPIGGPSGNARGASVRVEQIMTLRSVVRSLPAVVQALNGCHSYLLRMMGDMLDDERVKSIDDMVSQGLNDDALFAGGGGSFGTSFGSVTKKVYAVRANYNRLLDVARETYRENVTDIIELQEELSKEHDLPISMQWQDSGFVFVLKKGDVPPGTKSLPRPFINHSRLIGRLLIEKAKCAFEGFAGRGTIAQRPVKSLQFPEIDFDDITLRIVKALVERILEDIGVLYKASEAASSFPKTDERAVRTCRVRAEDRICFRTLSDGFGWAGKSTYLRQIGSLVVMAMCGSLSVLDENKHRLGLNQMLRIHDSLLTRLSNDDDPERSLSTFAKEMTTSGTILSGLLCVATGSSLILIDELGRGTSPIEGIGLAHAIAEEIIKLKFTSRCRVDLPVEVPTLVSRLPWKRCLFIPLVVRLVDGASDAIDHYGSASHERYPWSLKLKTTHKEQRAKAMLLQRGGKSSCESVVSDIVLSSIDYSRSNLDLSLPDRGTTQASTRTFHTRGRGSPQISRWHTNGDHCCTEGSTSQRWTLASRGRGTTRARPWIQSPEITEQRSKVRGVQLVEGQR